MVKVFDKVFGIVLTGSAAIACLPLFTAASSVEIGRQPQFQTKAFQIKVGAHLAKFLSMQPAKQSAYAYEYLYTPGGGREASSIDELAKNTALNLVVAPDISDHLVESRQALIQFVGEENLKMLESILQSPIHGEIIENCKRIAWVRKIELASASDILSDLQKVFAGSRRVHFASREEMEYMRQKLTRLLDGRDETLKSLKGNWNRLQADQRERVTKHEAEFPVEAIASVRQALPTADFTLLHDLMTEIETNVVPKAMELKSILDTVRSDPYRSMAERQLRQAIISEFNEWDAAFRQIQENWNGLDERQRAVAAEQQAKYQSAILSLRKGLPGMDLENLELLRQQINSEIIPGRMELRGILEGITSFRRTRAATSQRELEAALPQAIMIKLSRRLSTKSPVYSQIMNLQVTEGPSASSLEFARQHESEIMLLGIRAGLFTRTFGKIEQYRRVIGSIRLRYPQKAAQFDRQLDAIEGAFLERPDRGDKVEGYLDLFGQHLGKWSPRLARELAEYLDGYPLPSGGDSSEQGMLIQKGDFPLAPLWRIVRQLRENLSSAMFDAATAKALEELDRHLNTLDYTNMDDRHIRLTLIDAVDFLAGVFKKSLRVMPKNID